MVYSLLKMMKTLRQQRGLKQSDMEKRIGMTRQQYQRLEAKGNPRLETLELIASGLNSELMIIPKEKLLLVHAILNNDLTLLTETTTLDNHSIEHIAIPPVSHRGKFIPKIQGKSLDVLSGSRQFVRTTAPSGNEERDEQRTALSNIIERAFSPALAREEESLNRPTSAPRKLSDSPWRGTIRPLGKRDE